MRIIVRNFVDGKPAAREITFGYTTFWFASEHLIGYKYLGTMAKNNPGTGYAGQVMNYMPRASSITGLSDTLQKFSPVYLLQIYPHHPKIFMYAGRSANAFMINMGSAKIYFSYNKLIGFKAFDKFYYSSESDNHTMAKNILSMRADRTDAGCGSQTELITYFDRYFKQFEQVITCVPGT